MKTKFINHSNLDCPALGRTSASLLTGSLLATLCLCNTGARSAIAADDLSLRPGLSFSQDIDNGFPIVGKDLDDTKTDSTKSTFIFFGASGDLNTNRQAKRVVEFYHKISANSVKFVIVDVDHPVNDSAKALIKSYYKGYIPTQVLIDKNGKVAWSQTGEIELCTLKSEIEKGL